MIFHAIIRPLFVKDLDGTLSNNNGKEVSIFAQSEYQWEGVEGFDWSEDIDASWGLGDYRIPESMLTNPDGSVIPIEDYAPNKGFLLYLKNLNPKSLLQKIRKDDFLIYREILIMNAKKILI